VIDSGFESSKQKKERKKVRGIGWVSNKKERKKGKKKAIQDNLLGPKAKR